MALWKNSKVILLMVFVVFSIWTLFATGLNFGIDFAGGTQFQIHFNEKLTDGVEIEKVTNVVEQRLNWTGLKDVKVFPLGDEFMIAQLAETDPDTVNRLVELLKKQGRFEVLVNGEVAFTGAEIVAVDQSTGGYAAFQQGTGFVGWNLPFSLKSAAAEKFRDLSFHKCQILSLGGQGGSAGSYDCEVTYFFIDRPIDTIVLLPSDQYASDSDLFLLGNLFRNIPSATDIAKVINDAGFPIIRLASDTLTSEESGRLTQLKSSGNTRVVLPETANPELVSQLETLGFEIKLEPIPSEVPWLWQVAGLRSIVRLQPSITGDSPYVANVQDFQPLTDLIITGSGVDQENAQQDRQETKALMQSGSLPVSVESITQESVSPLLGRNFLNNALVMGLIAILLVALIIFIRYRKALLVVPIVVISLAETFISLIFISFFGNITLESIAAIIAAVGTGVNDQIIITDEMLTGSSQAETGSFAKQVKSAFFIIVGSAATTLATMLPILIFGAALVKLVGFAIATIVAVLVGVLITRPAFAEIAKVLIKKRRQTS